MGKDIADASLDPLGLRFDQLNKVARSALVESLCSLSVQELGEIRGKAPDFFVSPEDPRAPVWFVRRLNQEEYEQFIQAWAQRLPLETWEAWLFVWMSWTNIQGYRDSDWQEILLGWRDIFSIRLTPYQHGSPIYREVLGGNPIDIIRRYPNIGRMSSFGKWEELYAYYPDFVNPCSAFDQLKENHFIHWHPLLAPSLIDALLRDSPTQEIQNLVFSIFLPVAEVHPGLSDALSGYRAEQQRIFEWRQEAAEEARLEREFLEARRAETIPDLEKLGSVAMLQAVIDDWPQSFSFYPEAWAWQWIGELDSLPHFLLQNLRSCYLSDPPGSGGWVELGSSLRKLIKGLIKEQRQQDRKLRCRAREQRREMMISRIEGMPILERLRRVCETNFSVTYYPEQWATEAICEVDSIPTEVRQKLSQKMDRLRRKGPWKELRNGLLKMDEL